MPSDTEKEPNFLAKTSLIKEVKIEEKIKAEAKQPNFLAKTSLIKETKQLLDKFAKALSKIENIPESFVEMDENRRKEKTGKTPDAEFRKIFFDNAPAVKKECIEAERGKWK
jgi:hypothetical protein